MSQQSKTPVGKILLWFGVFFLVLIFSFTASSYFALKKLFNNDNETAAQFFGEGNIGVVEIKGIITQSRQALEQIEELKDKASIKAVLVRIESPGGAVGPSQEIYQAILRLKKDKVVACSLGDVAASGGYYIAAACDKIFANPGTLTGSIGVIMHLMNLEKLYSWAKLKPVVLKAGKFKDVGSAHRVMKDKEKELLQDILDDIHTQFKGDIMNARKMTSQQLEQFGDGRIMSGKQALKNGFVDALGGEYEAIEHLKKIAKISGKTKILRPYEARQKFRRLFQFFNDKSFSSSVEELSRFLGLSSQVNPLSKLKNGVPYMLPAYMFEGSTR